MTLFIRELRAYRKSLFYWCLAFLLMLGGGMGKYAGLAASGQSLNDFLGSFPRPLQSLFGPFDLAQALGFYGVLFLYLVLMATAHSAIIGADILAKEEEGNTAEFLLVKPVSRFRIITAKLLAALVNVAFINLFTLAASTVLVGYYSHGQAVAYDIARLMTGMFILQVIFMLTGLAAAAISRNPRMAPSLAAGTLLTTFMLSVIIDISGQLNSLKYLTPFKYFDAQTILHGPGFQPLYLLLSLILVTVLLGSTYVFYQRRDLTL